MVCAVSSLVLLCLTRRDLPHLPAEKASLRVTHIEELGWGKVTEWPSSQKEYLENHTNKNVKKKRLSKMYLILIQT